MSWIRMLLAFFCTVLLTTVLLSVANTQFNLMALPTDEAVSLADRLGATLHDIVNFGSFFSLFVAAAMLLAYPIVYVLLRPFSLARSVVFAIAGLASVASLHLFFFMSFDATIVAGSRDPLGLVTQLLMGALGGLVYPQISKIE